MAKGTINLSASNIAVIVILNKELDVQNIQIISNRSVIGEVREVNCMVKTKTETLDVKVWVHRKADGNYRKLFVFQYKEGVMSTPNVSVTLDPTRIEYRTEEDAHNFAAKNAAFCERVNSGEPFYFMADRRDSDYPQHASVELKFSFIALGDGDIIPTSVFLQAVVLENGNYAPNLFRDFPTIRFVHERLSELFGEQFEAKLVPEVWMIIKVSEKSVIQVGTIDLNNAESGILSDVQKFNPNANDQSTEGVSPNDLITMILEKMMAKRFTGTFLVRDDIDLEVMKETVSDAYFVGGLILNIWQGFPKDLRLLHSLMDFSENPKQTRLLETWYQAMLIYKREGFWPLIRAKSNQQPFWHFGAGGYKMFKPGTSNSAWHEDQPDTEQFLALSRAIRNQPVAGRFWEKPWQNKRGTDLALIQVWADPKSGFTYANWHRDQAGHVVSGDVETYKRHFGIKNLAAEVNPGSSSEGFGATTFKLLNQHPLDLEDGGEY